jgi:hypothetical protein
VSFIHHFKGYILIKERRKEGKKEGREGEEAGKKEMYQIDKT